MTDTNSIARFLRQGYVIVKANQGRFDGQSGVVSAAAVSTALTAAAAAVTSGMFSRILPN